MRPTARARWICLGTTVVLAVAGCGGGRASSGARAESDANPVNAAPVARIDAIAGRRLVVPLAGIGADASALREVRLEDGRPVPAAVRRLHAGELAPAAVPATARAGWLSGPGRWWTSDVSTTLGADGAVWSVDIAVLDLPEDASGALVLADGTRVRPRWLDAAPADAEALASPLSSVWRERDDVRAAVAFEAGSPFTRWRAKLALGRLGGDADRADPTGRFADETLEALASGLEDRWIVALRRLHDADAALAARVRARLALFVEFPAGESAVVAPAWPPDSGDLDALLLRLTDSAVGTSRLIADAEAWLDDQPPAAAWVADDAASRDAIHGSAIPAVGVASLNPRPEPARFTVTRPGDAPFVECLKGPRSGRVEVGGGENAAGVVDVRVGAWARRLTLGDVIPVRPPGLTLGPMLVDWSLPVWLSGRAPAVAPGAAVFVHRRAGASGAEPWALLVESAGPAREEWVRVWLGPSGRPATIYHIGVSLEGAAVHEEALAPGGTPARSRPLPSITVARSERWWSVLLPVPASAVARDGTLFVAVEQQSGGARGVHSAWPRPMLPWQLEPGRAALDLSAWDSSTP